jgi:hypothetical protein
MNPARAALLFAAVILSGCAATKERPDATKRTGFIPAQERPGLGTSWGEQRESWVEPAPFARASAGRPAGQERIYYNDRDGANAMLDFLGGPSRPNDGLQNAAGGLLRLGLRAGNGAWLECREARGRRIATAERPGRYEVVLKNDGRRAVEVLVSVDGLDAMDGKAASFKKRGYVLAPFETLAVEGFRTSQSTVAAFRFGSMFESYGHRRHGNMVNAGVIGVAVFEEKRRKSADDAAVQDDHAWRATGTRPPGSGRNFASPPEA